MRNVQLAMFGLVLGTAGMLINDGANIRDKGLFFGYDAFVVGILSIQAFGGLLVGVVVKYADNILKGFAAAVSIVLSCVASVYLFHFQLSMQFLLGAGLVMIATYVYGASQGTRAPEKSQKQNYNSESDKTK